MATGQARGKPTVEQLLAEVKELPPTALREFEQRFVHCGRDRPGTGIGPAACTCRQIRRPTLSASAMTLSSSIVRTLRFRITNWPSIITDSTSDGWPLWIQAETNRAAGTRCARCVSTTSRSA